MSLPNQNLVIKLVKVNDFKGAIQESGERENIERRKELRLRLEIKSKQCKFNGAIGQN